MRRSRDWYRHRYHALVEILKTSGIPMPWSNDRCPDDFSEEEGLPEVEPPRLTPLERVKREVLHDLGQNCHQAPSRHRYSDATKTFAFAIHVFSNACYRLMREVLDLPSDRTLRDSFNAAVGAIDGALADVDRVTWIISEVKKSFPDALTTPVRCTLCIDAFSVNPTPCGDLRSASGEGCNNSFLFQLTPLNRRIRVVPLHLHPAQSGVAGPAIREVAERVIVQVKQADPRIVLNFVSVDGDEGYCHYFRAAFAGILRFLDAAEFGDAFRTFICDQQPFWVSDWLHLLKNSRVRLFRMKVFVNPQSVGSCTTMEQIAVAFTQSPTFTDDSTLGKMRDAYPLDLFTLQRAYVLWERGTDLSGFLYLFVFGLWNEAVENRHFTVTTRILILETLMLFFYVQYTLLHTKRVHPNVSQKRSGESNAVTFATESKLERFLCTLSGQLTGFLLNDPELGIDRIGSHTEENFIGHIRSIAHGDHRFGNVKHQVARFELARAKMCELGIERKVAKRVNLGGISLGRDDCVDLELEGTATGFAADLVKLAGIIDWTIGGKSLEFYPTPSHFIEQIWRLMDLAPLGDRFSQFRSSIQNLSIIDRYRSFDPVPEQETARQHRVSRPGPWSLGERQRMASLIVQEVGDLDAICAQFPDRSRESVRRAVRRVNVEVCHRPWEDRENSVLVQYVRNGVVEQLPGVLIARSPAAICEQIDFLRTNGYF
jgi:hypothetical protein